MSFKEFLKEDTHHDLQRMKETLLAAVPRRAAKTAQNFDTLIAGYDAGKMYNVHYKEAMDSLSRCFEEAWDGVEYQPSLEAWREWIKNNNAVWGSYSPRIANTPATIKQLEKYIKTYKLPEEFYKGMMELLVIFAPFKEINEKLKANLISGRAPNPNAANLPPKFMPKYTKEDALKVTAKFKEICSDLRDRQIKAYVEMYRRKVGAYQEKIKDMPTTSLNTFSNPRSYYNVYKNDKATNMLLRYFIDSQNNYLPYKDVENLYLKEATRSVDELHEGFIGKNVAKLSSLIGKLPLKQIKTINMQAQVYNIEAELFFEFETGASFYVVNKAVYTVNQMGTAFLRFPTTFHDVKKSDGTKLSMPSEEKMNKEWA